MTDPAQRLGMGVAERTESACEIDDNLKGSSQTTCVTPANDRPQLVEGRNAATPAS